MRRPVVSWLCTARVVVALVTRRNTLPVAPWLVPPIGVSLQGKRGVGAARRRTCIPSAVAVSPLRMPRVFDRSSNVWAAIAVIVGTWLRTVAGGSGVRTIARVCRGGAFSIIGSPVPIGIGPCVIAGPMARIAEIVGRPSALAAAVSVEVRTHHRAATAGSCTPPAGAVRSHDQTLRCGL
jgi:hypothetical protein